METLHTAKPRIIVALLPTFIRNILLTIPFSIVLFGAYFVLNMFVQWDLATRIIIISIVVFTLIASILPLIAKITVMYFTTYRFFESHVIIEIKIIKVKRQSMPYHQIINISTHVNLWNRLWSTGDITLHSADEAAPDLILKYVKNPSKIENSIHHMINTTKSNKKA